MITVHVKLIVPHHKKQHVKKHSQMANEAFVKCLEPTGRPHLSVCELGQARSLNLMAKILFDGDDKSDENERFIYETSAKKAYSNLLTNWVRVDENGTHYSTTQKSFACQGAFSEATSYTVQGPSYKQNKGLSTGAIFAISFGVIAGVAILAYSAYYVLRMRRRQKGDGLIDYDEMVDASDV